MPCPNCGYCPTCGRSNPTYYPNYPYTVTYTPYPLYTVNGQAQGQAQTVTGQAQGGTFHSGQWNQK